jgi:outer membrane biosynthesis protein TonB
MNYGRQLVVFGLASALLLGSGCSKKKPQLPAQAKAPADTVASPLPSEISETAPPPPPPQAAPQPPPPEVTQVKPPKRRSKKKVTNTAAPPASLQAATPPAAASAPANDTVAAAHPPPNPVATNPDLAIAADVSDDQLAHQKHSTAQLLEETEKSIGGLKGLTSEQNETLAQVRSYINQSRKATSDGDFERAYNLATKAHLLSDALIKK